MKKATKIRDAVRLGGRLYRQLRPHAQDLKKSIVGTFLVTLLALVMRMAQPWPLKWIVDHLSYGAAALPGALDPGVWALELYCGAFLVLSLMAAYGEYLQMLLVYGVINRTTYGFRQRLFRHVISLPLNYHEKREVGEMITRVVLDISRLRRGLAGVALKAVRCVLVFLATVTVLFWIDWVLALVALGAGVLSGVRMVLRGQIILSVAKASRKKEGKLSSLVEENLQGIRELQTYRGDGSEDPRFDKYNAKALKSELKLRRLEAGLLFFVDAALTVVLCGIIWVGTVRVTNGILTTGDLVLFLAYMTNLYRPFAQFARQAAKMGRTLACSERLVKIVEKEPEIADRADAVVAPRFRGVIEVEDLTIEVTGKSGASKRILSNVSFQVEPGSRVAILGPNGAGKSTILRHVLRLADPRGGRILIDGRDLREYTIASLREQFSVVHQGAAFFGLSVRDNIALGRPGASDEEVLRAAECARVTGIVEALPEKFDTVVKKRGKLFSQGEQQRIALSRAILRDGGIWLLDEPLTGLDGVAAAQLEATLLEATQGRTTLWVTHYFPTVAKLDRIVFLEEGEMKFFGPADEFARWARAASPEEVFLKELSEQIR